MAFTVVQDVLTAKGAIRLLDHDVPLLDETQGEVLVQWLAAPINRVDLMVLADQYPAKPKCLIEKQPVPGFDGFGKVLKSTSAHFQPGDKVLPAELGLGTWRTHAKLEDTALIKLPEDTPAVAGALLRSGAIVAWLLLEQTTLSADEWIIMSAGTSCVAQFLVQMARIKGINVILVIRDRPDMDATTSRLLELGAAAVWSESELAQNSKPAGKILMAIDCVFGQVGQGLADVLSPGGKFILAGMLGGPNANIAVDTKHLFYKQLSFQGFRGSNVLDAMGQANVATLFWRVACLLADGQVKIPEVHTVAWDRGEDMEEILQKSLVDAADGAVGYKKVVWILAKDEEETDLQKSSSK